MSVSLSDAWPAPVKPAGEASTPVRQPQQLTLGHATSTTRASSSPATSARRLCMAPLSARRSLGRQLEELEVLDAAASDCDTDSQQSAVKRPFLEPLDLCSPATSSSQSPCNPMNLSMPEPAHAVPTPAHAQWAQPQECHQVPTPVHAKACPDAQTDASSVEDWSSPRDYSPLSSGTPTSPCSAREKLDKSQRVLADAILAELQVDLESGLQKALGQMSSWVSEEFVFLRQGLEEDINKAATEASAATAASKCLEMQHSQDDIRSLVEKLQLSVNENTQQVPSHKAGDVANASPPRSISAHATEAAMAADERRWRMKLGEIETNLSNHLNSIDALGEQLTTFSTKFAMYDVDLRANSQAVQRMEAQLRAAGEKDRPDTRALLETHSASVESLNKRCSDIEALVAGCDIAKSLHSIGAQLSNEEAERLALKSELEKQACALTLFEKFELRLNAAEIQAALGEHAGNLATNLEEQVALHNTTMQNNSQALASLELRVDNAETSHLAAQKRVEEQVTLHSTIVEINSQALEKLELRVSSAESSHLAAQKQAAEQFQGLSEAIRAQIFASEEMQSQILTDEQNVAASLADLHQELYTQLSKVDTSRFAGDLARIEEVTKQLVHTSVATEQEVHSHTRELKVLVEGLAAKSSKAELDGILSEVKGWVTGACETQQKTMHDVSEMFNELRASSEAQNGILEHHEWCLKDLSTLL